MPPTTSPACRARRRRRSVSPVTFVGRHPGYLSCEANKRGNAHASGEVFSGPGNDHQPPLPRRKLDRRQHLAARSDQTAEQERVVEGPPHDAAGQLPSPHRSGEYCDARHEGQSSALVSQSHLSAATGDVQKNGFKEYEFPRGIGWLPAATDGSSRVTPCASAFNRAATRQAARRRRR
jgi:hypothetical protein